MALLRCGLAFALTLGACGCVAGGSQRASDTQNLKAIGDDISAVTMTRSDTSRAKDPNMQSTIPRNYEISNTR